MNHFLIALIILAEILWFIMLLHLMTRPDSYFAGKYDKLCWVAVLLFANAAGALAYLIVILDKVGTLLGKADLESLKSARANSGSIETESFEIDKDAPGKCPICGKTLFYNTRKCLSCGWSYQDNK